MDLKKLIREVLENKDCCTATKPTKAPILNEGMQSRVLMTENMQYHIDNKKPLYETTLPYGSKEYLDLWVEARYLYSRGALNVEGIDKEKITETHLGEYGMFEGQLVPLDLPMIEENSIEEVKLTSAGVMDMVRRVSKDPKLLDFLTFKSLRDFLAFIKGGSLNDYYEIKNDIEQYDQQLAEDILNEAEYQGRKVQLGKPMQGDSKKFKVYVKNDKGKVVKVNFGFGGKSAKGKRMVIKDKNPKKRAAFRARHNCKNPGPRWKARYWSCKAW
jgi:hypothetical protein